MKFLVNLCGWSLFIASCATSGENEQSSDIHDTTSNAATTPVQDSGLTAEPAQTWQSMQQDQSAYSIDLGSTDTHNAHDHDHDHEAHAPAKPDLTVWPKELTDAMTDSGSYNVDMTRTQRWNVYTAQFRDSEKGPATDTVFVKATGKYDKDRRNGLWAFYESRDRKPPLDWTLSEEVEFRLDTLHGVRRTFKNGRVFKAETFKDGVLHGPGYYYDEFGELVMEVNYRNGLKDGLIKKYGPGKKLLSEVTFSHDIQQGPYKHYYPNGRLKEEGYSDHGVAVGSWKLYHDNGQLWTEREYRNGKPWRVISNFTPDGKRISGGNLQNGTGTIIIYDESGVKVREEQYVAGERVD